MRLLTLCFLFAAASAAAQPEAPEAELVYAATGLNPETDVFVGTVPDGVEAFVPEDGAVLGSVARDIFGPRTLTVVTLDAAPEVTAEALAHRHIEGWSLVEDDGRAQDETGFVSDREPSRSSTYYSDTSDLVVNVSILTRRQGGSYALVSSYTSEEEAMRLRLMGSGSSERPSDRYDLLREEMPRLTSPQGARQSFASGGGGSDHAHSAAQLASTMRLSDVIAHYDGLVEAAGWVRVGAYEGEAHAVSSWTKRSASGSPLALTVMAAQAEPGMFKLTAAVSQPE